jgi:hypothetical protein
MGRPRVRPSDDMLMVKGEERLEAWERGLGGVDEVGEGASCR